MIESTIMGGSGADKSATAALRFHDLIVFTLLAAYAAVMLPSLASQSLWLDEALTVMPVRLAESWKGLIALVQEYDTQPPGSHALLYLLHQVVPATEFWMRLPSLVAIALGLAVLYLLVARLWDRRTALLFLVVAVPSPLLGFYAMEARNYGLWFLLAALSSYAMVRWLDAQRAAETAGVARSRSTTPAMGWMLAWALANAAGLWTHLFHVFVMLAQLAAVLVVLVGRHRKAGAPLLGALAWAAVAQALTWAAFAPWLVELTHELGKGEAGVPWTRTFGLMNVPYYLFAAHVGVSFGPNLIDLHTKSLTTMFAEHPASFVIGGGCVAGTVVTYVMLARTCMRDARLRWECIPLIVMPATVLLPLLCYAAGWGFPLHIRHLLCVWPLLPLVVALGAVRFRLGWLVLVAVVALECVSLRGLLLDPYYAKDDARAAVRFAESHSRGPSYVLGDVAEYYADASSGHSVFFQDFAPDTEEVWLIVNRAWDHVDQPPTVRLETEMRALGLQRMPSYEKFHGIVLDHWRRPD